MRDVQSRHKVGWDARGGGGKRGVRCHGHIAAEELLPAPPLPWSPWRGAGHLLCWALVCVCSCPPGTGGGGARGGQGWEGETRLEEEASCTAEPVTAVLLRPVP